MPPDFWNEPVHFAGTRRALVAALVSGGLSLEEALSLTLHQAALFVNDEQARDAMGRWIKDAGVATAAAHKLQNDFEDHLKATGRTPTSKSESNSWMATVASAVKGLFRGGSDNAITGGNPKDRERATHLRNSFVAASQHEIEHTAESLKGHPHKDEILKHLAGAAADLAKEKSSRFWNELAASKGKGLDPRSVLIDRAMMRAASSNDKAGLKVLHDADDRFADSRLKGVQSPSLHQLNSGARSETHKKAEALATEAKARGKGYTKAARSAVEHVGNLTSVEAHAVARSVGHPHADPHADSATVAKHLEGVLLPKGGKKSAG